LGGVFCEFAVLSEGSGIEVAGGIVEGAGAGSEALAPWSVLDAGGGVAQEPPFRTFADFVERPETDWWS